MQKKKKSVHNKLKQIKKGHNKKQVSFKEVA